jgi:NUMOD4 motif|uniref:HNH endonuclease n=1 Tax=Siphoviridae sp. ctcK97 TaxID=2825571 RepID=A0A8S5UAT8_9CAUD|nr:MAG TPA: HNH endonuclease [Siphoviridae sp. ctcK97]
MYKEYADIWATVPGFAHYEANRLGDIKRKDTGVILKPFKRRNSTSRYVRLYTTPGEARERSVASVIWAAFYKRWPDRGLYVCHADGDLENNSLDNLFLGNRSDVRKTRRRRDDVIWAQLLEEGELVL